MTESERSVAVGSAAPEHGGNGDATAVLRPEETAVTAGTATRAMTAVAPEPPAGRAAPAGERRVVRPRRWPARALVAAAGAFVALVALGLVLGLVFGEPGGSAARDRPADRGRGPRGRASRSPTPTRPRTRRRCARRWRATSSAPRRAGRAAAATQVVDQYDRQFDGKVGGYELDDLDVQAGRGGRASGTYHVERDEGDPYDGSIVFGVVRERGEPRIALIAFEPSS